MFAFFSSVIQLIGFVINFVINVFKMLIMLVTQIPKAIAFIVLSVTYLPPFLVTFIMLFIAISVTLNYAECKTRYIIATHAPIMKIPRYTPPRSLPTNHVVMLVKEDSIHVSSVVTRPKTVLIINSFPGYLRPLNAIFRKLIKLSNIYRKTRHVIT